MPTPEPPPDTSTFTFGATFLYSSAQAWARFTIVSEPFTWMEPDPLDDPPAVPLEFAGLEGEVVSVLFCLQPPAIIWSNTKTARAPCLNRDFCMVGFQ